MNKGLKQYNKFIEMEAKSSGKMVLNVSKLNRNMHMILPLIKTTGNAPIELGLIYNKLNSTSNGILGNGFRFSIYNRIYEENDDIYVEDASGAVDVYLMSNGFKNQETGLTISKVYDDEYNILYHYEMVDLEGNKTIYGQLDEYPTRIEMKNGDIYYVDFVAQVKTISNNLGDELRIFKQNGLVSRVEYYFGNTSEKNLLMQVDLSYSGNNLISLEYFEGNNSVNKTEIAYTESTLILKNVKNNYVVKYSEEGNVIKLTEGYNVSKEKGIRIESSATENLVEVINEISGESVLHGFDSDGLPTYTCDKFKNLNSIILDKNSKKPLSSLDNFNLNDDVNNLLNKHKLENYNMQGLTVSNIGLLDGLRGQYINRTMKKISGTGELSTVVAQNAIDTDVYTVILMYKILAGEVKVSFGDRYESYTLLEKYDDYQVISLNKPISKSIDELKLTFNLNNATIDMIDPIVIASPLGAFYDYDENGNATKISTGSTTTEVEYDSNGKPVSSLGRDSTANGLKYNSNGAIESYNGAYGTEINNVYDGRFGTNILKTTLKDKTGTKILELRKEYTSDGKFVSKEYDELGNCTSYEYEGFLGKIKQVKDALGHIVNTSYKLNGDLFKISSGDGSAEYEYYSDNKLKSVMLGNGSKYEFEYDTLGNVIVIKLNGCTIYEYSYDSNGRISEQKYGLSAYKFTYDNDNLISSITYLNDGAATTSYKYIYDACKRVKQILDENNKVLYEYAYNANNEAIEVKTGNSSIKAVYDNLDNLTIETRNIEGNKVVEAYDPVSRSKGSTPEAIEAMMMENSDILFAMFNKGISKEQVEVNSDLNTKFNNMDGIIPYMVNDKLTCHILKHSPFPEDSGFTSFWFKPTTFTRIEGLFSINNPRDFNNEPNPDRIDLYLEHGLIKLYVTDYTGERKLVLDIKKQVNLNSWNFIALDFMNRYDEGNDDICEYMINLNGELFQYTKQNPRIYCENTLDVYYNYGCLSPNGDAFSGCISGIVIANHKYLNLDDLKQVYRISKDYFADNAIIKSGNIEAVDFSQTTIFSNDKFDDLCPLQNTVESLNGVRPIRFKRRSVSSLDKDRSFNFNMDSHRYAYVADGGDLVYDFNLNGSFTVMFRATTDCKLDRQCLIELKNEDDKYITLFRGNNYNLFIELFGRKIDTGLSLYSTWNTVALSVKQHYSSESNPNDRIEVRVMLNGEFFTRVLNINRVCSFNLLSIGKQLHYIYKNTNLGGRYEEYYPFHGQIEMLGISNSYNTENTINSMAKELNGVVKSDLYDDLGMLKKKEVRNNNVEILSNSYEYKTRADSKYISKQVACEKIRGKSLLSSREYTLDAIGNITGISDPMFGNSLYQYNDRGYLSFDGLYYYNYDKNGNILEKYYYDMVEIKPDFGPIGIEQRKIITSKFNYDDIIKDRLISINNQNIVYDNNNPLNPISYNGNTYRYEGRRLVGFNDYSYKYDVDGKRISKQHNGIETKYYYSGDRLVAETNNNIRIDYLYDENLKLIGFIHNNNKYFYVRDVLENILGIVDINGDLVVKYNYDAWGSITSITGTLADTIGLYNSFRYKGYYYDTESCMYYCKSRYYVPEWCRWLNADNPTFLDPMDLDGMNLFTYCQNNPVMFKDDSGNSLLLSILGAAAIGAIVNIAVEFFEDYFDDKKINNDVHDYVYTGINGAINGAISKIGGKFAVGAVDKASKKVMNSLIVGLTSLSFVNGYFKPLSEKNEEKPKMRLISGVIHSINTFNNFVFSSSIDYCYKHISTKKNRKAGFTKLIINKIFTKPIDFILSNL